MRNLLRRVMVWAVCVMGMALLSPLAAQVNQQAVEGSVNIYNLDRDARTGGIEIHGRIGKAVANEAVKLLSSTRPDVDELTVFLNSPGGDVFAAMELGEEIRRQWALTSVDDDGECFGACVLVLAAGVRRTPASENIGLRRMSFAQKDVAKKVEAYLSRMGMPKKLFQEIAAQQSSNKLRLLDSGRLKHWGWRALIRLMNSGCAPMKIRNGHNQTENDKRLDQGDALIVRLDRLGSALAQLHRDLIIGLAARHKLPAVYFERAFITAGGLVSYGPSSAIVVAGRKRASLVGKWRRRSCGCL
jgi:ATP-dependent protease ClpP protease subunit